MQSLLKRLFKTLLLVSAILLPSMTWAAIIPSKPSVGNGSSENPYLISTASELYWFAALVNGTLSDGTVQNTAACAKLRANITVNSDVLNADGTLSSNSSSFTQWTPIGNYNTSEDCTLYTGIFDGNGKTISGLYFNNADLSYVGLFGYSGGTVKNVGVVDSYFNGNLCVGGICGYNYKGIIFNCYHLGTIVGYEPPGGVCGYNQFSTIANCYYSGSVCLTNASSKYVGGVCGYSIYSVINNCYYNTDKCSEDVTGYNNSAESRLIMGKTTAQFRSGEVAYLLSQGCTIEDKTITTINLEEYTLKGGVYDGSEWGQTIGT
ncbi:MAG: GLUG motif-containing protein, partial [Eubacterium sp.]